MSVSLTESCLIKTSSVFLEKEADEIRNSIYGRKRMGMECTELEETLNAIMYLQEVLRVHPTLVGTVSKLREELNDWKVWYKEKTDKEEDN